MRRRDLFKGLLAGLAAVAFPKGLRLAAASGPAPLIPASTVCAYPAGTVSFWHRGAFGHVAAFDRVLPAERVRQQFDALGGEIDPGWHHYAVTWDGQALRGFCDTVPIPAREVPAFGIEQNGVLAIPAWWAPGAPLMSIDWAPGDPVPAPPQDHWGDGPSHYLRADEATIEDLEGWMVGDDAAPDGWSRT